MKPHAVLVFTVVIMVAASVLAKQPRTQADANGNAANVYGPRSPP
jgi:hypothetical protein